MFKYLYASLALVFVSFVAAPQAEAARIPVVWGMSDHFDPLAKMTIPAELRTELPPEWSAGEAPELTHHSESFTLFWFVGLSIADKGLAVHVPGTNDYWEVTDEDVALFKEVNILPADFKDTGIAPMTYFMSLLGYLVILGAVGVGLYIKSKI